MRKIFLGGIMLGAVRPTKYVSDDFELGQDNFDFPLTYVMAGNVKKGDQVLVVTVVEQGPIAKANYCKFQEETTKVIQGKGAKEQFVEIPLNNDFDALTFNRIFKQVVELLEEGDRIYMDATFGKKPVTMGIFTAATFMVKTSIDIRLEAVVYSDKYNGTVPAEGVNMAKLHDVSSLFYLNSIAGNIQPGNVAGRRELLNYLVEDREG